MENNIDKSQFILDIVWDLWINIFIKKWNIDIYSIKNWRYSFEEWKMMCETCNSFDCPCSDSLTDEVYDLIKEKYFSDEQINEIINKWFIDIFDPESPTYSVNNEKWLIKFLFNKK